MGSAQSSADWHLDAVLVDVSGTRQVVLAFLGLLAEDDDLLKEENSSFSRRESVRLHGGPRRRLLHHLQCVLQQQFALRRYLAL